MNEKQDRILEAAEKLFARFGHKKTSIDEIAQLAGLGKGTIYLYFRSKDELYAAVVRKYAQSMMQAMREAIEQQSAPVDQLRELLLTRLRFPEIHLKDKIFTVEAIRDFEEDEHGPLMAPIIREFRAIEVGMIYEVVMSGVAQGVFETPNPGVTAFAIYSALHSCGRPWPNEEGHINLEDKAKTFVHLFCQGLIKRS